MKHLVVNSFPRSGNVFLTTVVSKAFSMNNGISAVHMPEIFQVKEIYNVSIFRDPKDAISSLINKGRENVEITNERGEINDFHFNYDLERSIKTYTNYLDAAETYFDNIQIVSFEDLSKDYKAVINQISAGWGVPVEDRYEEKIASIDFTQDMWSNSYDGHLPRPKDPVRLEIERLVASADEIDVLTSRYSALLNRT